MEPFTAASHDTLLHLLVQVPVLLLAARVLGELSQRAGQPSVVGEILAGIVLGPSLLSGMLPALGEWLVPRPGVEGYLLEVVSLIGAMFLLLITGLETDVGLIRRHARTAIGVSFGGILVTFSSGFALGWYLPADLIGGGGDRLVFALFVATAMSISAIPVIAKVLMDLNLMRRDVGQTIIAAGMSDDTVGWILLSIVAGLAASGAVTAGAVGYAIGSVLAFLVISLTLGRWLFARALALVQDEARSAERLVTLVVACTFAWGAITHALGLEAVLGAFMAGVLFGQLPRLPEAVHRRLITISIGVFTPIFFAVAGLKVDARGLLEPRLLALTLTVIAVASAGKVLGTYAGARLIGRRPHWNALMYGAGLNARGAMEIIIATIGLQLGILSQDMFSIIVVMAMATSLMAPPALRFVLARVTPEPEELRRLQREERAAGSHIAAIHRVLVPERPRAESDPLWRIKSGVLNQLGQKRNVAVTLLSVARGGERQQASALLRELEPDLTGADVTAKVSDAPDAALAILDEAKKDYQLLVLGATEYAAGQAIFHPMVDELVRLAPCPSLVVRSSGARMDWPARRVLVPTNGSLASRNAAELAFVLAGTDAEVLVLNVLELQRTGYHFHLPAQRQRRETEAARGIVRELRDLGALYGSRVRAEVRSGAEADEVILRAARDMDVDLIVLGTDVRPASKRLYLGPRVGRILDAAPCPVLVLNSPG